jgi:hypothetical protein
MSSRDGNIKDMTKGHVKDVNSGDVRYMGSISNILSYNKINKLITALYMVTDVMDTEEPIRNKLRSLGVEVLSDISLLQKNYGGYVKAVDVCNKITEILSFLDVTSAMNFISEMNFNILKKEFISLKSSVEESVSTQPAWLAEFSSSPSVETNSHSASSSFTTGKKLSKGHEELYNGQITRTRIGVQKGGTLMKALLDVNLLQSIKNSDGMSNKINTTFTRNNFDILRKERREQIVDLIKKMGGSATITDIKNEAQGSLASCGEKTLQRELLSMTKDGVLDKTGEKRWSRYLLKI